MGAVLFDANQFAIAHHVDCGVALMRANRHQQAILEYEAVLKLDPNDRYARWGRALARLSIGDYKNGMAEHDWAWQLYKWHSLGEHAVDHILKLPEWKGERCRLILYHEMGFGDAIMCLRFLPWLAERCESVTLAVRPELVRLMSGYGVTVVGEVPENVDDFDARATLFNSIWLGGWTEVIPTKPYIDVKLNPARRTMGIVWSGNSQTNFSLKTFLHHLDTEGFELFALQKCDNSVLDLNVCPLPSTYDFKDSAEFMATLDTIVTVDTAAAHLAGAIGHPNAHVVIPYLRDWRWWHKDRWYPTLNLYPQDDPGNWDAPFARVNEAIHGSA